MTEIPKSRSVAIGCVAEPTPRFYDQVLRLVRSIRWFGGSLSDVDVFVCFVGEIETAWRMELESLGAHVRMVEPFNPLNRFSNKIRFLELPELAQYETAMLLDCDMALVQDPAPYLMQPALQLMIADLPTVPSERLARLCVHFGLAAPAPIYRTTCSQEPTIWYCNTGVMILPTAWIERILPPWRDYILRLCAEPTLLDPPYNHCNQAAMALTYIADPLPFAELPVAMNFPLHQTGRRPAEALLREDPVILHYHDRVDADGLLLPVPYPLAQARIQLLNQRLRAIGCSRPVAPHVQSGADDRPTPRHRREHHSSDEHGPMPFIIGAGRSGSLLLRLLLNGHPELAIPPETHFIPDIARACRRTPRPAERFVEYLTQHARWPCFHIDAKTLDTAIGALEPFNLSDGLRTFYGLYAARFGKPRYGDKTLAYGASAEQIQMILPEARFIHVLRDGRDVALSYWMTGARNQPLDEIARHWAAQVHMVRRQARELKHYLELRYEDLVLEPNMTLRRICEYLELRWDPAMLASHRRATGGAAGMQRLFRSVTGIDTGDNQRLAHHRIVSRPIQSPRGRIGSHELSPRELATIEAAAGDILKQIGYPLTNGRVGASQQTAICITGMHRSGTSLVGQILHHCGPYLGPYRQLTALVNDNLDGYWEHPDFHQLNEAILAHFGGGWDLAPDMPAGWADLPGLEALRQRARALIRQCEGQQFWGWKDPRSALTISFWRQLIPELKVVICVRNPLEVAQSLSRRGMSSLAFGLRLWQTYYERLLAGVAPQDRIITHYDTYFTDAVAETQRLLGWLNIRSSSDTIQLACHAVSDELRHHRDRMTGSAGIEMPTAVLQLYNQLCDEAGTTGGAEHATKTDDPQAAMQTTRLSFARTNQGEYGTALGSTDASSRTELAVLEWVLRAREAELASLQSTLAAREIEIANYARELQATRDVLAAREIEIANYARELQATRDVLAAREIEIADYAHELQARGGRRGLWWGKFQPKR